MGLIKQACFDIWRWS